MGASHVEMHTEAGWVRFVLPEDRPLDFHAVADTLDSASYELHDVRAWLRGHVRHDRDGAAVLVLPSGQRLRLTGATPKPGPARVAGEVEWREAGDPRLRVTEVEPLEEAREGSS